MPHQGDPEVKYTKEELSPTKVRIAVNVEAEEINAAIDVAVAMQQTGITLKGFRKGHVPASLVEKRFKGQLYHDAANKLTQVHLNTILGECGLVPVTGLTVTPTPIEIERNKDVQYTVEFEHLPKFDLPSYEGLEVEQERASTVADTEIDALIARMRARGEKLVPVDGTGPAVKGQYANVDLSVFVDGEEVSSSRGTDYLVGQEGFPPLDELVSSVKVGESGEKEVTFPEDFYVENLRGKSGVIKVKTYAIKEMKGMTDEELLAETKLSSMGDLRKAASERMVSQKNVLGRSEAQNALLEKLLAMVDFPLPEALVEGELSAFVERAQNRAMQAGKTLTAEQEADVRKENLEKAQKQAKTYVLLRTIAEKEGLKVSEREVQMLVARQAKQMDNVDPQALYKYLAESGQIYIMRDQILINKAVEAIYGKARVNMVEGEPVAPKVPVTATQTMVNKSDAEQSDAEQSDAEQSGAGDEAAKADAPEADRKDGTAGQGQ